MIFACNDIRVTRESDQITEAHYHWNWAGYDNAWVERPSGRRVQSVPGGTHWGGGLSISPNDQLKIAQMLLDDGVAGGRRMLSKAWIDRMRTPRPLAPLLITDPAPSPHSADIALLSNYIASSFPSAGDGHGGASMTAGSHAADRELPLTLPHRG